MAIPPILRAILDADANAKFLVARHETESCLTGYGRETLPILHEWAQQRRLSGIGTGLGERAYDQRLRRMFGLMAELPHDEAGLHLPPLLREISHIGDNALFVGKGICFEIWEPRIARASDDEELRILAQRALEVARREGVH